MCLRSGVRPRNSAGKADPGECQPDSSLHRASDGPACDNTIRVAAGVNLV